MPIDTKTKMVRAAVAPRHTVMAGPRPQKAYGPGMLVELAADEADHLMRAGFLQDPNAPAAMPGPGPFYGQEGSMISSPAEAV